MKRWVTGIVGCIAMAAAVGMAPISRMGEIAFDFKDPKGVNGLTVMLDSELEPIVGTASGITGEVTFDPSDPKSLHGTLRLETKGIKLSQPQMTGVLMSGDWLDAEKYPSIEVTLDKVTSSESKIANGVHLKVDGKVTIKSHTEPMSFDIDATYLSNRAGDRMKGATGDLLKLRTTFVVKRSVFGIKTDAPPAVVADDIVISGALIGHSASSAGN